MVQVHRNSVFADACAALLPEATSHMSSGPSLISPAFLAAPPDTAPSQLGSSQGSLQQSSSAGSIHVTGHSITSTALYSSMDEHSSTAPEVVQCGEADRPTVTGNANERGVSPALQEEGEGHGPRKEFFAAIGVDITSAGCSPDSSLDLHGQVRVCQKLAYLFCVQFCDECLWEISVVMVTERHGLQHLACSD